MGLPVVCGSTGWLEKFDEAKQYCIQQNGTLVYASNYSIGVNLFFEINQLLGKEVCTLLEEMGYQPILRKDLHGNDRMIMATLVQ